MVARSGGGSRSAGKRFRSSAELLAVYRAPTLVGADRALGAWIRDAATSGLVPFERTARTLRRWRAEILNYWRYPITTAVVEGKHNRMKVLKTEGIRP